MTKHELEQMVKTLVEENQRLQQRIAELERELARARKTSRTSSKPPSSDIVKSHKTLQAPSMFEPRHPGGQPGHPKHERPEFSPEEITKTVEYSLSSCPTCGGGLTPAEQAPRVIQQMEIVEIPIQIEEHRGLAYWCPACQRIHYAPFAEWDFQFILDTQYLKDHLYDVAEALDVESGDRTGWIAPMSLDSVPERLMTSWRT
jgi:hypothetical protein